MLNPTLVRSRRRSGSRDSAYIRPLVEQLEKKTLLTVIYVNSSADSGGGTLRAAIEQSNGDPPGTDVISVSGIPQITLDSSITITAGVTINGAGVNITAPEGVFVVNTGPGLGQTVYMNYITTQSGAIPAAITVNQNSSLTVTNCNLYGYGQGAGTSGNGTGLLVQGTCVFNNGLLQGFDNGAVIGATGSYTTKNVAYYNNATTGLTTAGKTSESASYYWQNGNNSAAILNSGVLTETGGQILGNGIGAGLNSSGGSATLMTETVSSSVGTYAVYVTGGMLMVNQSFIQGNSNGALYAFGNVAITNTTISTNVTTGSYNVVFNNAVVSITTSNITSNVQQSVGPYQALGSTTVVLVGYNNLANNGPQSVVYPPYYPPYYPPVYPVIPVYPIKPIQPIQPVVTVTINFGTSHLSTGRYQGKRAIFRARPPHPAVSTLLLGTFVVVQTTFIVGPHGQVQELEPREIATFLGGAAPSVYHNQLKVLAQTPSLRRT